MNMIKNKYYTYNNDDFLPVFYNGELLNKREFHLYKLLGVAKAIDSAIDRVFKRTDRSFS